MKKRFEVNEKVAGVRGRASRTGGVNTSVSPLKGITLNSKHGARVSKTYKGLTLGLQKYNSVVRGRWSSGGINLNLSKSGFTLSTKGLFGTFNILKPNRSAATIFGIQFRGNVGMAISAIGLIFKFAWLMISLIYNFLKLTVVFLVRLLPLMLWLIQFIWNFILLLGSCMIFLILDLPKQIFAKNN